MDWSLRPQRNVWISWKTAVWPTHFVATADRFGDGDVGAAVAGGVHEEDEAVVILWGVLLDYAAGVIPASAIRASGASGAIRYVSDRRPGGAWMLGKPIQLPEARDLYQGGLKIVSCYQFGKADTADWLGG